MATLNLLVVTIEGRSLYLEYDDATGGVTGLRLRGRGRRRVGFKLTLATDALVTRSLSEEVTSVDRKIALATGLLGRVIRRKPVAGDDVSPGADLAPQAILPVHMSAWSE